MIGYKDKTFCSFYETCKDGKDCPDALTPQVEADALKWWESWKVSGENRKVSVPIFTHMKEPECWKGRL